MRAKLILTLIGLSIISLNMSAHRWTDHSVLNSGKIVKVKIRESGWYRINYEELQQMGLRPEQVRVLGYGGALLSQDFRIAMIDDVPSVCFYMDKGDDGVFNSGDFIAFYAQGPISWEWKDNCWQHKRNTYSDYGYYFLSDNAGEQRIISMSPDTLSAEDAYLVYSTQNYQVHEQDLVNLLDLKGVDGGGREWYGEEILPNKTLLVNDFYFPNIDSEKPLTLKVDAAAKSTLMSTIQVTVGDQSRNMYLMGIDASNFYTKATTNSLKILTATTSDVRPQVSITFFNDIADSYGRLNYVELTAVCDLIIPTSGMLPFRYTGNIGAISWVEEPINKYLIAGATQETQVWNLTDPTHISQVPTWWEGDTLCCLGHSNQVEQFVAINPHSTTEYKTVDVVGSIDNQDLHSLHDIDYVIVTPEEFYYAARALADAHELFDGLRTAVVTDEQVYNEFSSGTPDATAIRRMMKMIYDRAVANGGPTHPISLLLMGDGTFDNRQLLSASISGQATLLTYEAENSVDEVKAYATDDYFGMMDDADGMLGQYFYDSRGTMEISVGRLPVNTEEEAWQVVNKLIEHMEDRNLGRWKQEMCFLADDGDHGLHTRVAEAAAERTRVDNPEFIVNKLYLDAYIQESSASGETYPVAYNQFQNLMKNGVIMMDYSGHGSANNICSEGFLTIADVKAMTNKNRGFWMMATCSYSHFDHAEYSSAEHAILNPNGGAIGILGACRTVYASQNDVINRNICDTLFAHSDEFTYPMTIGEAVRCAKNQTGIDDNKMAYVLLGDPALRLNYPTQYRVVVTTPIDTLHATSHQRISGYIMDANGDTVKDFDGAMAITIFDKMQVLTTRDNDETDPEKKQCLSYNDYPNKLFKGETDVVNGQWNFDFMLPKDIQYNYGNGRMVFYAWSEELGDGVGYKEDFLIGGSDTTRIEDNEGPSIFMYINDIYNFQTYDGTYEKPHFYAELADTNGINTIGSGIGHDLLLVLDGNNKTTYVMNDYFTADRGTYTRGKVSYSLGELAEGEHHILFKAWDLLNNSSSRELKFTVTKGAAPRITDLTIYPNPASANDELHIVIHYDQPDEVVYATLLIADLSGHLVAKVDDNELDGDILCTPTDFGLSPGIYIYSLQIKSKTGESKTKAEKLIIH